MKLRPAWTMGAVVLLACASIVAIRYIDRIPSERLASLMGITVTVSELRASPSPSPIATPVGADQTAALGSVAVQTFLGPKLVRQGPGTAVSADGLILTTIAAAPYGSGSYVYQVATLRGELLRARRVASHQQSGLALLKVDANNLDAVFFDATAKMFAGQSLEAISAHIIFSKFISQRIPVWAAWVSEDGSATVSMDRSLGASFNGARLVDQSNRSVGILRFGTAPVFVSARVINAFLESYFVSLTPTN